VVDHILVAVHIKLSIAAKRRHSANIVANHNQQVIMVCFKLDPDILAMLVATIGVGIQQVVGHMQAAKVDHRPVAEEGIKAIREVAVHMLEVILVVASHKLEVILVEVDQMLEAMIEEDIT